MRVEIVILLLAAGFATACRDTVAVDSCGRPHACEVPGWDLALVSAALDNAVGSQPGTGIPIAPRELRVRFTVRNRGTDGSLPRQAVLRWSGDWTEAKGVSDTVAIAPLPPGDSATLTAMLHITTAYLHYGAAPTPVTVQVSVETPTGGHDDYATSDTLSTAPMQLALPVARFAVEPIGRASLQVNEQFRARYRVWNAGFVEPLTGVAAVLCLWHAGDGCWPRNFAAFGRMNLPPILPGDTILVDYPTAVAPTAAWQDEADDYWYSVCIQSASWQGAYLQTPTSEVSCLGPEPSEAAWVRVRPDYEGVCAPPALATGSPLTLRYNCGFMPIPEGSSESTARAIGFFRFHLTALDAVAGVTYVVQPGPSYVYDSRGERALKPNVGDTLRFASSGRYYLESFGADTLTFTLRQR
ncbi:MAG: hypothetical protein FIB01_03615 [Gemmatimonadetes bacterium]|nr:hypothetical protein [Gemmatimonadota bacterium]